MEIPDGSCVVYLLSVVPDVFVGQVSHRGKHDGLEAVMLVAEPFSLVMPPDIAEQVAEQLKDAALQMRIAESAKDKPGAGGETE